MGYSCLTEQLQNYFKDETVRQKCGSMSRLRVEQGKGCIVSLFREKFVSDFCSLQYWPHLEFVYECKNLKILVCIYEKVTSDTEFRDSELPDANVF